MRKQLWMKVEVWDDISKSGPTMILQIRAKPLDDAYKEFMDFARKMDLDKEYREQLKDEIIFG